MFLYVAEKVKSVKQARTCPFCRKTFKGEKLNRHVTTDHMQQLEDLKNANGLESRGAFLKIWNMGILEHNKEEARKQQEEFASIRWCSRIDITKKRQGSNERSLLPSAGVAG